MVKPLQVVTRMLPDAMVIDLKNGSFLVVQLSLDFPGGLHAQKRMQLYMTHVPSFNAMLIFHERGKMQPTGMEIRR